MPTLSIQLGTNGTVWDSRLQEGSPTTNDGSGIYMFVGGNSFLSDRWHRVELRWRRSNSGDADVWVDGSPELSVTGEDFLSS